jgi:translation elongation factor EF-Tu-like GTPase
MFDWIKKIRRKVSRHPVSEKPLTLKEKIRQKYEAQYVGQVTHFFPKIGVGIIKVEQGNLNVGDVIYIQGHKTRFKQKVGSIEYNHQKVRTVGPGYEVGVRFGARVRETDDVYVVS